MIKLSFPLVRTSLPITTALLLAGGAIFAEEKEKEKAKAAAETEAPPAEEVFIGIGDFGSPEPVERTDLPDRGILKFELTDRDKVFVPAEHWEQYNFAFKAVRPGRYQVRANYILKSSALTVQFKLGEQRLKKQLPHTAGLDAHNYLGEVTIDKPGDQIMVLYTPNGVGWAVFELLDISLIPAPESGDGPKADEAGALNLLAKDAITWSEHMRYEPKPEKNCLGYWTEKEDFAEWEFTVEKSGKYQVTVHQGCGAGGGSEVAVLLSDQELKFKVEDTGGFQKWKPVVVGELKIEKPGTYRLAVKPQTKSGKAIMDVQKVVLSPVS